MKTQDSLTYQQIEASLRAIGQKYARVCKAPFKGRNFMTPEVPFRGKLKNPDWFVELSYGTGIFSNWIFGVTFLNTKGESLYDESKCYHSLEEIEDYLQELNEGKGKHEFTRR